jgi:hypothetical protein
MTGSPMFGGQPAPAQGSWQQVPGGYTPGQQQVPQQAQLPPGLQAMQSNSNFNLPPQMGGRNPLEDPPSPLAVVPPNVAGQRQAPQNFQQQQQFDPRFQQQAPQLQFQQPQGADATARLTGPNVPLHYQGRTVGEVIQMLEGARQMHFQQQQAPAPTQSAQNQPTTGQPPQSGTQQAGWDWRNPTESVSKIVEQANEKLFAKLQPMLGPVAARNLMQEAQDARTSAAREIGVERYQQLEPAVMDFLRQADPQSLTNPETWKAAVKFVVGDMALRGVQLPAGQQQQGHQPGVFTQNGQVIQNPAPNMNTFFSEQPGVGVQGPQGLQMTSQDIAMASAMNIPLADYAAWKQGIAYSTSRNGG